MSATKRCSVAYAAAAGELLLELELPAAATVGEALAAARAQAGERPGGLAVPWDAAPVGIFGERTTRAAPCRDGDRIELYRELPADPRTRRRAQVARERGGRRR
ncbi:MAG: RnfH family protein [Gammaproteobacteria bacterium]|nr:RnfH family protein [Gammaproteobacteria bacterium]MBV9697843.1 RnfH family protein [Gammaproteobacteria bacterium]